LLHGRKAGLKWLRQLTHEKIIYFCRKNTYSTPKGAKAVEFLIQEFSLFGFEGQNWMLIVVFLVAAFVTFVWRTRDKV
jgi:hypothetical protein